MSPTQPEHPAVAGQLLNIVGELADELHPRQGLGLSASLDSILDKELGYDSLGRMELLVRLERAFDVILSENLLAAAETPRQLLEALQAAQATVRPAPPQLTDSAPPQQVVDLPQQARTLPEVLDWHVQAHPERPHIYLYRESGDPETVSYRQLLERAQRVAEGLRQQGLGPGQSVALMLPTGGDYFYCFFGVLLGGGIPVPIYPPARLSQVEDHLRRHARILDNAQVTILITVPEARAVARLLKSQVGTLRCILDPDLLQQADAIPRPMRGDAGETAFLQYTSGSTGNPKGVELSHANLLANVRAMGAAVAANSSDVFISWLPLYHDMGLIGAWFGSLYFASPLVIMSPLTFLARPHNWLWAIDRFHGTLSAAPNFAYELCLNKIRDEDIQGLDLSSWRLAFNGAEAVSPQTVRRFSERFEAYGFQAKAMTPVYGLAENSVGLTFPPLGRGPCIDRVQRDLLSLSGQAEPAAEDTPDALQFVACGRVLAGHQIRIVDPAGQELPERREGRLQFRGPSSTRGYFRNPEASRELFQGGWLDSGDRAYMAGGEVYLTGRAKDIIIRAGRNIFPQEVEQAVGQIEGMRKGCVAVFGSSDPVHGTERMVVLAETRLTDQSERQQLRQRAQAVVTELVQMPPDELLLVPPQTVLKTSSGKIRRAACRALYEQGGIERGRRHVWWQFVRLSAASAIPQMRRMLGSFVGFGYAVYAWLLFLMLAVPVWLLVLLLPRMNWRWAIMGGAARLLARATGVSLLTHGMEHVPDTGAFVLVANHASYLDGILLVATLPRRFTFVAKAELQDNIISRLFLRRIGCHFVERFDARKGVEDSRRIAGLAHTGEPLMFFPEGTFERMPGLLPFRMGAFIAAAQAGVPVVPVALRGARYLLPADTWRARRTAVRITAEAPIMPQGDDWTAALELRDGAREAILRHSGEPDLGDRAG
jgi:1-acyl-sn-glycerol-3-phosphate acyltransferase